MKYRQVVATTLDDIKALNTTRINSIELAAGMDRDGITPDINLVEKATNLSKIPIRVMVRHQQDFVYNAVDFQKLLLDIVMIKQTKAEGIVIGILTSEHEVDVVHMQQVMLMAYPLKVTFLRAFDVIRDKTKALQQLVNLGVDSVLTQGGQGSILASVQELQDLQKLNLPIWIMVGGGVNVETLPAIANNFDAIHVGRLVRQNNDINQPIDVQKCCEFININQSNGSNTNGCK